MTVRYLLAPEAAVDLVQIWRIFLIETFHVEEKVCRVVLPLLLS
jgi:hypothetical protein